MLCSSTRGVVLILASVVLTASPHIVGPTSPHLAYDVRTKLEVYNTGELNFWPSVPNADYNDTEPLDPFERGNTIFPEQSYSWSLDCESGQALRNCNSIARPACDAYCIHQCYEHCSEPMDQRTMSNCLSANDAIDCSYNINEYLFLPTRMCRATIGFNSSQPKFIPFDGTVYLAEPDWESVSLANFKRLKKAVLTVPMAAEFDFSYVANEDHIDLGSIKLPKDMGNLINLADGFNISSCKLDKLKLPFTVASLQNHDVFRSDFGSMYHKVGGGIGEAPFTYENDITRLLHARSLQVLGGLPKQLLIWWSGVQPALHASKPLDPDITLQEGQYTQDAILKVMYQYPPARFFSSGGFHTLTMDSGRPALSMRTSIAAAFFVAIVFTI